MDPSEEIVEDAADQPSQQDEPQEELTREQIHQKLDGLYDKLPKIIARIDVDNPGESVGALTRLLSCFRQINELEEKLLPEGMTQPRLSLSRIYEMANNGGGASEEKLQELAAANAAFAEENKILAETIETLSFQVTCLKRERSDELIKSGKVEAVSSRDLAQHFRALSDSLGRIERAMDKIGPSTVDSAAAGKPLHERMIEALSALNDISAAQLAAVPQSRTIVGKMLCRAGFAYDYKDVAVMRILIAAALESNHRMAATIDALTPLRTQVDQLKGMLSEITSYAGHDVRQSADYKDALSRIEQLQAKVDEYEAPLNDLKNKLASKQTELELKETILSHKESRIRELQEKIRELEGQEEKLGKDVETRNEELRNNAAACSATLRAEKLEEQIRSLEAQIKVLEAQAEKQKKEVADIDAVHKAEISSLTGRMQESENGLLVQKLEAEIVSLREKSAAAFNAVERQKEVDKALVDRATEWIDDARQLKADLQTSSAQTKKWQTRSGLKLVFSVAAGCGLIAASATVAVIGGYGLVPLAWYFGLTAASGAVVGGIGHCIALDDEFQKKFNWRPFPKGALIGGIFAAAVAGVGLTVWPKPTDVLVVDGYSENFVNELCSEKRPCEIYRDSSGSYKIMPPSDM